MDIDYLLWLQDLRNASHPMLQKFFSILGSNAFLFLVLLIPCIVYWCVSKRKGQVAKDFRNVIADLRLVVMVYQSFNTDRLDEREKEIANIFEAMRMARKKFANGKGAR